METTMREPCKYCGQNHYDFVCGEEWKLKEKTLEGQVETLNKAIFDFIEAFGKFIYEIFYVLKNDRWVLFRITKMIFYAIGVVGFIWQDGYRADWFKFLVSVWIVSLLILHYCDE